MLKQRIITALVLLAVLLPALFAATPWPFALLTLVMIGAAGWEWSRLNGAPGLPALVSNRHPLLRLPTSGTAPRVMVHGLETEALHHLLLQRAAVTARP